MIITITYDAKCKHCRFFNLSNITKKDGSISKIKRSFCINPKSEEFNKQLTLKSKACDKIEI
jgi:hypothetical protein